MIKWVIFSKDRAAQLDLLLRSMKRFVSPSFRQNVNIIYRASDSAFEEGYQKLWGQDTIEADWFKDSDSPFKQILTTILEEEGARYVGFLCDDDVFIRELLPVPIPAACYTYSLRLNPRMPYSLNSQKYQAFPIGTFWGENHFIWDWPSAEVDYAYPYSVSGSIWRLSDLVGYIDKLEFHHPNSLEDQLVAHPLEYPKMICGIKNSTINIPSNLVQNTHNNPTVGKSAAELNRAFLRGEVIDLKPLIGLETESCFVNYQYTYESRNRYN